MCRRSNLLTFFQMELEWHCNAAATVWLLCSWWNWFKVAKVATLGHKRLIFRRNNKTLNKREVLLRFTLTYVTLLSILLLSKTCLLLVCCSQKLQGKWPSFWSSGGNKFVNNSSTILHVILFFAKVFFCILMIINY